MGLSWSDCWLKAPPPIPADYIDSARKSTFSYTDLWALKEGYLERLHRCLRKGSPAGQSAEKDVQAGTARPATVLPDKGLRAAKAKPAAHNDNKELGRAMYVKDVARHLGVDVKTVRKYHTQLGGVRLGRRYVQCNRR